MKTCIEGFSSRDLRKFLCCYVYHTSHTKNCKVYSNATVKFASDTGEGIDSFVF